MSAIDKDSESESEDELPQLSEYAQAALQEFYQEQTAREQELQCQQELGNAHGHLRVQEDWQLSQFWYEEETALTLAQEALDGGNKRIICISCPTLYAKLIEIKPSDCETILLEYDRRFAVYGDQFVYYDYKDPLNLPKRLTEHSFDIVIADPPYLSEECLRKTAQTITFLTKGKILLCTGAVMESLANQLMSLNMCSFVPRHTRNLANEFRCFVNYESKFLNSRK